MRIKCLMTASRDIPAIPDSSLTSSPSSGGKLILALRIDR